MPTHKLLGLCIFKYYLGEIRMKNKNIFLILLLTSIGLHAQAKNIDYYSICLDFNGVVEQCSDYAIGKYKAEMTTILNQVKKNNLGKYNLLKNQQTQWLKNAEKSCENSPVHYTYCMYGEYDERLTKLKKQLKK